MMLKLNSIAINTPEIDRDFFLQVLISLLKNCCVHFKEFNFHEKTFHSKIIFLCIVFVW